MAINKTINKPAKTHGTLRNCIEYVLREHKTEEALVYMTGPAPEILDYNSVYQSFLSEKRLWDKDSGRMCAHNVISFHKDEKITLQEALEFGKEFAEKWFEGFQTLVAVHKDREHIHIHFVTNSVSFQNGYKLHTTKQDMERMKQLTNQMCSEKGLFVAVKGKNFYGENLEEGTISSWSKDEYNLLKNDTKDSFLASCAIAYLEVISECRSKEEFISKMEIKGWKVNWKDSRKNIAFINEQGQKVRDKKLSNTFHLNVSKEAILDECERQNGSPEQGKVDPEFERYYREVEAALGRSTGGESESQKREPETQDGKISVRAKLQESQARVDVNKAESQRKERQNKRTGRDDR